MTPLPQLDPSLDEPLYRQLFHFLRDGILQGRLASGERIPPTRELAGLLGLNRATVSAAYELLESEGLLSGQVGRGSFVTPPPLAPAQPLPWDEILPAGDLPETLPSPPACPGLISFASSRPADHLFPLEEFRATVAEAVAGAGPAAILQLGSPYGFAPLRAWLWEQARSAGVARDSDELLITNGCQQALDLVQRTLTTAGDAVLIEDPVYPGLRNVFLRGGVRAAGIPFTGDGLDLAAFERLLARERPRLVVLTPNFQNPTGHSLSLDARLAVLRVARAARVALVENDIYGELRYAGDPVPTLKQLDETGDVIQLKSFSKIAFPGLRVGWVLGPAPVLARLAQAKQWCDLHADHLAQAVLLRFAESGRLLRHQHRIVAAGTERLRAALAACERHLPPGARFTRPQGGMNLWVRLPEPLDAAALLPAAERAGVSYLPGRFFAVSRSEPGALRLSFAGLAPAAIESGVAILGQVAAAERSRRLAERLSPLAPAVV